MNRLTPCLCSSLLVLAAAQAASADVIQLTLSGNVQFSNMTAFPVGQPTTVTIQYESSGSQQFVSNQQAFYINHLTSAQITSGAYNSTVTGTFGQIDKYDNLANTDGISFQVAANQATYQYTNPKPVAKSFASVFSNSITQTFDNIIVNLASNSNNVWSDYTLPTSYNSASFDQTQNVIFAFSGGSLQIGVTNLVATNLTTSAPEPASLSMLALGAMVLLRRRSR